MAPSLLQASAASFVFLSLGHTVIRLIPNQNNPGTNDMCIDRGQRLDIRPTIQSHRADKAVGLWDCGVVPGALTSTCLNIVCVVLYVG
jgi:hypothetical protein